MKKIFLASVLKPCDDTRMYEKFAQTLSTEFEVTVAGSGNAPESKKNIHFISLLKGRPTALKRIFAWFKCLSYLFKTKPNIVIVHCPELLPILFIYKCSSVCKTIYDVRENYFYNIWHQSHYHGILKYLLAYSVRWLESLSVNFINGYVLAEQCYNAEFTFHKRNFCIVENKFAGIVNAKRIIKGQAGFHFVFTGTISVVYGIWEALHFIEKLQKYCNGATLTIAGHIVNTNLKTEIIRFIGSRPYVNLIEGNPLLPHSKIIEVLNQADFALLPYQTNKSTESCIPTKMYECLALKIPMLVQKNEVWQKLCSPYYAALFLDFSNFNTPQLLEKIASNTFYQIMPGKEVLWGSEEKKLMDFISEL